MGLATKVGAVDGQLSQPTSSATPPKYRLNTPLTPHKPPKHPLNTPQTPTDVRRCVKLTGASPCHPSYACKTLVVSQVECHAIIPRGERSSRTWPRPCPLDSKTGKLKSTPLLKFFKTALRTQYDMLCNAYTFYGQAVQVEPMKLNLEPPGTERSKLKCDDPLSFFAFNFSLRRYTTGAGIRRARSMLWTFRWGEAGRPVIQSCLQPTANHVPPDAARPVIHSCLQPTANHAPPDAARPVIQSCLQPTANQAPPDAARPVIQSCLQPTANHAPPDTAQPVIQSCLQPTGPSRAPQTQPVSPPANHTPPRPHLSAHHLSCPPRQTPHFRPSFLELNDILVPGL